MDVWEMLVDLLCETHECIDPSDTVREHYLFVADYLISNGVTVHEWIPVNDRLPEHGDVVLCFMKFGEHRILQWDNVSSWWLGYGQGDDWQKSDVTHWSKMPQPPKGE